MSDPVSAPSSIWEWLVGGVSVIATTLVGVVWHNNEKRMDDIEEKIEKNSLSKANKDELNQFKEEFETNRIEMRQDIGALHQKIDAVGRDIHAQIAGNQSTILTAIANAKLKD